MRSKRRDTKSFAYKRKDNNCFLCEAKKTVIIFSFVCEAFSVPLHRIRARIFYLLFLKGYQPSKQIFLVLLKDTN